METEKTAVYREHESTEKPGSPPTSPIGGIRVGCGSRACIVCKIWVMLSEVARGVRDSEDINPVVGKVTLTQLQRYVTSYFCSN